MPAGGTATITASSTASPERQGHGHDRDRRAPPPAPAGINISKSQPKALLSPLKIGHIGKRVIVGKVITGGKAGTLMFTATIGRKVLGRCTVKAKARKTVTCKIVLKRNYPLKKVRMTAQLKFAKSSVVRRAFVVR